MALVENLTPFALEALPSMALDGTDLLLAVVAGRFDLPKPGAPAGAPPLPSPRQTAPYLVNVHHGEPATSSLEYEGQSTPIRRGTDVSLLGHAWAPLRQATERVDVVLRVGDRVAKSVAVFGDRVWTQGIGGPTPTSPRPFVSMPLVYERAFGGEDPRNPVGVGTYASDGDAIGKPLPNLEDPGALVGARSDRPAPAGFGPIARGWKPRADRVGTYDARWVAERVPNWPDDVDPRFFQSAPDDLVATPHLTGGEAVSIRGASPDGEIRFTLPTYRLVLKTYFKRHFKGTTREPGQLSERRAMALDALIIEPDEAAFTMVWRASTPLPRGMFEAESSVVRARDAWEAAP